MMSECQYLMSKYQCSMSECRLTMFDFRFTMYHNPAVYGWDDEGKASPAVYGWDDVFDLRITIYDVRSMMYRSEGADRSSGACTSQAYCFPCASAQGYRQAATLWRRYSIQSRIATFGLHCPKIKRKERRVLMTPVTW